MRILVRGPPQHSAEATRIVEADEFAAVEHKIDVVVLDQRMRGVEHEHAAAHAEMPDHAVDVVRMLGVVVDLERHVVPRSEEHTSELQSLMRISYAVFCLKKKKNHRS